MSVVLQIALLGFCLVASGFALGVWFSHRLSYRDPEACQHLRLIRENRKLARKIAEYH